MSQKMIKSVSDAFKSLIDDSRVMLQTVASLAIVTCNRHLQSSLAIVTYDRNLFIVQATGDNPINYIKMCSWALNVRSHVVRFVQSVQKNE